MALVHDWLETYAGAERVLEQLITMYPAADVFALVDFVPPNQRGFLQGKKVHTSFIQHLPFARRYFRYYLPLFPLAMWMLNLKAYTLILSDSHCMAKNVRVRAGQTHVCYCHSPVRYAWDMLDEYLAQTKLGGGLKGRLIRMVMAGLRWWDKRGSQGVSTFMANSHFIAQRIQACYGRQAHVVHPPVAVDDFTSTTPRDDFYFTCSRMVPYKKMDMIAAAFAAMPTRKLVIIGDGPEMPRVRQAASHAPNIHIMGYQPFGVLKNHLQRCKAFVFAAKEDFGIVPVEAMAAGAPVIGYAEGGLADSVVPLGQPNPTGVFFHAQTVQAIIHAVQQFEDNAAILTPANTAKRATQFAPSVFQRKIREIIGA